MSDCQEEPTPIVEVVEELRYRPLELLPGVHLTVALQYLVNEGDDVLRDKGRYAGGFKALVPQVLREWRDMRHGGFVRRAFE